MAENPLGKATSYASRYSPELLFPIPRAEKRSELDSALLEFHGEDIWNAYELSWLNTKGLPQVALGEFRINAATPNIIESKSLKLYLNSLNQTRYPDWQTVRETIESDLSKAAKGKVKVKLYSPTEVSELQISQLEGETIDNQDISISEYQYQPDLLKLACGELVVEETLVSHLLKSNCLITSQPDWASLQIRYQGHKINREALLRYLVSFRSHNEFHEQCVERIFADLKTFCHPEKLAVYARYTRRGGLDINPYRSDFEDDDKIEAKNLRVLRQ